MLLPFPDARRDPADLAMLPASRLVPPPITARRLSRGLSIMFLLVIVGMAIAPWQQNVSGAGRVIAFSPVDRQQSIEAPVKGVIETWYVREGEHVEKGQPLARIRDNDPEYFKRLGQTRATVEAQLSVYEAQVEQLAQYVAALEEARAQALAAAEASVDQASQKLRASEQKLEAAIAADETASINLRRSQTLHEKGLISDRKLELATLKATKTRTDRSAAEANRKGAQGSLREKRSALLNKQAEATAKVENARASRGKAEVSVQGAEAKLLEYDVKLARQRSQEIVAPIGAYVLRIDKAPGQEQVKQGDLIAVLVPDTQDRVAEVYVDGNDAALISPGRKVRLQFEGWPAVQFAGWPSVAVGTFGGVVKVVDSADDGKGDFRILVSPDPDDATWPSARFLRQGTRAKSWILLSKVTLGYELWRRFNGFPPAVKVAPTGDGKSAAKGPKAGKGHGK